MSEMGELVTAKYKSKELVAFHIHADPLIEQMKINLHHIPPTGWAEPQKLSSQEIDNTHKNHVAIGHADLFLKGQPHDRAEARKGLQLVIDEANRVTKLTVERPVEALAAEKNRDILNTIMLSMPREPRLVTAKPEPYKNRYPKAVK